MWFTVAKPDKLHGNSISRVDTVCKVQVPEPRAVVYICFVFKIVTPIYVHRYFISLLGKRSVFVQTQCIPHLGAAQNTEKSNASLPPLYLNSKRAVISELMRSPNLECIESILCNQLFRRCFAYKIRDGLRMVAVSRVSTVDNGKRGRLTLEAKVVHSDQLPADLGRH